MAGTVVEINAALVDAPELVNSSPYTEGWMIKIRPDGEAPELLNPGAYRELIGA